ncbi:potassium channel family protein [Candidatus Latescibacterota bacterium]
MYVIIGGGGLIGAGLVQNLTEQKHDVVLIERDHGVCEEIYAKYGAITIEGNATDLETLENAGIERCDVAVATMKNDADNLAFAMLAKHNNVSQIIVRMNDPKYEDVYKTIGVKNISRGTELLIGQIMFIIENPELRTIISFGEIEIDIFMIPPNAQCVGDSITNIVSKKGFPNSIIFSCLFLASTQSFIIPKGNTVLSENDKVFICGSRENIKEAIKFLD